MATNRMGLTQRRRAAWLGVIAGALLVTASAASAETLLMPKRDFLMSASEVVWGVTDQANGTAFTLDYGDGSADEVGIVADRSYIAFNHTYTASGPFTVTLTVGVEVATVVVNVYNGGSLSAAELRGLNVNRTIHNGLRYLWFSQVNRAANFPAGVTTNWGGSYPLSYASVIVLSFENHGFTLPNSNAAPTGVYEKYIVRRGLNYLIDRLSTITLTNPTPNGDNPCAGALSVSPCTGLMLDLDGGSYEGYSTSLAILPIAGSNALSRTVAEITGTGNGGFVVGKSYGDIVQRLINGMAHGQGDFGVGRGGWNYNFNSSGIDGSTMGWNALALLDAGAGGVAVPSWLIDEVRDFGKPNGLNTDGTFDYSSDANPAVHGGFVQMNIAKAGIGGQALYLIGQIGVGNAQVAAHRDSINARWAGPIAGDSYACANGTYNKGCGYGMFNVFKSLKLHGITELTNVNRPAGSVGATDDWYADYVDWLIANQTSPTSTSGGNWAAIAWSCCDNSSPAASAALAELILSPVALIAPDPDLFREVGLSPESATNPVGTSHTVTGTALSSNKAPIPGVTIDFEVMSGPNVGKTGTGTTNGAGQTTFTYTDTAGPGVDTIQAFIGSLASNVVSKTWVVGGAVRCDADADGDIDKTDIGLIRAANRTNASGPSDPKDGNGDGKINVADQRYCMLRCTNAQCAPGVPPVN